MAENNPAENGWGMVVRKRWEKSERIAILIDVAFSTQPKVKKSDVFYIYNEIKELVEKASMNDLESLFAIAEKIQDSRKKREEWISRSEEHALHSISNLGFTEYHINKIMTMRGIPRDRAIEILKQQKPTEVIDDEKLSIDRKRSGVSIKSGNEPSNDYERLKTMMWAIQKMGSLSKARKVFESAMTMLESLEYDHETR